MATDTTPSTTKHDASDLFESLTFTQGISKKSGNPYIVGQVRIKSPIGAFVLDLEYLDENAANVVRAALEQKANTTKDEFAEGLKG